MALTVQEVALVQASFGRCSRSWTSICEEFFARVFKKYQSFRDAFAEAFDGEQDVDVLRGQPMFNAPISLFKGGFSALIGSLGDGELLGILVHKLAINHVRRGLDPKRFEELFQEFYGLMSEDPATNRPTLNAWKKAMGVITSLMASCMAEIRSEQSA